MTGTRQAASPLKVNSAGEAVRLHAEAGRRFRVGETESFTLDQGQGPAIVLLHGIPASSYLYRKVVPRLAESGFRALAFDLPGLGLASRPSGFDYSLKGLTTFTAQAIEALKIDRCHLVVHDIGGPIGCLWAAENPERVRSLTILNTVLNLGTYRDPWTLEVLKRPRLGPFLLRLLTRRLFTYFFYRDGIYQQDLVSKTEVETHYLLLRRLDNGRAFLRINQGWLAPEEESRLRLGLADRHYPAQVIWGRHDPVLRAEHRALVEEIVAPERVQLLDAKHFVQEDHPHELAVAITSFASGVPVS
jgi:pimeloyl-ACP methyl ester carboxylesterase